MHKDLKSNNIGNNILQVIDYRNIFYNFITLRLD